MNTQTQQPEKAARAPGAPVLNGANTEKRGYKPGEEAVGLVTDIASLQENNLFDSIPAFVPGKPGFDQVGMIRGGIYLKTKRAYSNKLKGAKKDEYGRKYRDLHIFQAQDGKLFGIWSTGQLGATLSRLNPQTEVFVRYDGLAAQPLEEGQDPPHTFTFLTKKGVPLMVDWNKAPNVEIAALDSEVVDE